MEEKKTKDSREQESVELVRVLGKDIRGDKKILVGLTKIKGISWAFSNALCKILAINKNKLIGELTEEDIENIENFMKKIEVLDFLKNHRKDIESGDDVHFYGSDLTLKGDFDIKRLRKIKCYKGVRHTNKLPVRGQRTKANFRSNKKKTRVVGGKK
jgi:small subunit ribosomal protein S13